eukprot:113389-Rhodomonas_salina.3
MGAETHEEGRQVLEADVLVVGEAARHHDVGVEPGHVRVEAVEQLLRVLHQLCLTAAQPTSASRFAHARAR